MADCMADDMATILVIEGADKEKDL